MTIQHTCSFKHLTLSERAEIEVMINKDPEEFKECIFVIRTVEIRERRI